MSHLFHHTHTLLYLPSYLAAGLFFVELVCPSMWVFPALRFVRVEDCIEGLRIHSIDKVCIANDNLSFTGTFAFVSMDLG